MYAKKCTRNDKRGSKRKDPYRPEAVKRILAARDAAPDPNAPTDPDEFMEWLHAPETEVKP